MPGQRLSITAAPSITPSFPGFSDLAKNGRSLARSVIGYANEPSPRRVAARNVIGFTSVILGLLGGVLVKRRELLIALGGAVLVFPRFATAQSRVAHIAVLVSRLPPQSPTPIGRGCCAVPN